MKNEDKKELLRNDFELKGKVHTYQIDEDARKARKYSNLF
jgi:hypothetical protein